MNVAREVVLTCSVCGTEGPHELLYLSGDVAASRCATCGTTLAFLPDLRMCYAGDIAVRAARLPRRFVGEAATRPLRLLLWPAKALRKPFRLLREMEEIAAFRGTSARRPPAGRRSR